MRSTFKVLFFLKRDKQKANGMVPLFCRITVDGNEARFGMKCDVNPKYWEVKTGRATGKTAEALKINTLVENTNAAIYRIYRELQERDNYVTAEKIKNIFLGIEQKYQTLLELLDYHNRERKSLIGVNITQGNYLCYIQLRRQMADFMLYKYNLSDISVKEINRNFIVDFELYLQSRFSYARNTIVATLKRFRHIIEVAVSREWINQNPFKDYDLQWQKVDRGYLTQEEIDRLIDCPFADKWMDKARDIFIFCTFTGLSCTGVKFLTYDNIQSSFDGQLWIKGRRKKTGIEFNIPLLNIPKMIPDKYKGRTKENRALPVYCCNSYYKILKKMAKECGIEKKVSSHLARHTFATLALTKGVSIESVSKMLGHSNINTTQIYAKVTGRKIGNEMNMFAGNIKQWDARLQPVTGQKEISLDDMLKSLKISTGKASDTVWENLTGKVWDKVSDTDRQTFVSELAGKAIKPKSLRNFYLMLMDYFLENIKSNHFDLPENANLNTNTQFAVNY